MLPVPIFQSREYFLQCAGMNRSYAVFAGFCFLMVERI